MEQRCPALAFHRPVRNRARSIYGAPSLQRHALKKGPRAENLPRLGAASASTCQHGAINAEDPVTSPPRRQSFSQFAGIARSDSQSAGSIIIICKRNAPLGPTYPITCAGSLGSEQELAPQNQHWLSAFVKKPQGNVSWLFIKSGHHGGSLLTDLRSMRRARERLVLPAGNSGRDLPSLWWSDADRVPRSTSVHNQRSRAWRDSPFDTRLISASVRWRTEGFRLRRLQPKAGCSAPEIIRRTANLAQSYYEFVTLDYLRST